MHAPKLSALAIAVAIAIAYPSFAQAADAAAPASAEGQALPSGAQNLERVEISGTRKRLDAARNGLSPDTGSSIYRLDRQDINNLPLGESTPLNQVILQTPGVVQDSYGQLHVRGDHANVQYRINGVIIPESISGFGQALETRFAEHLSVLTGALPAQYGLRNAAVVDIQSKGDSLANEGHVGLTLGSHGHVEPSIDVSANKGPWSYFVTASALRNDIGIENPTASRNALHDTTRQAKSFGLLSYVLGDDSRVSLMFGTTNNRFQIPNVPGLVPSYVLTSAPPADSAKLDARQDESNRFAALSYQGSMGAKLDYQVSMFARVTDVHYRPDFVGDLLFNGIAADILRRNDASGLQADASYKLDASHTLRAGLFAQQEKFSVNNAASVFPADASGNQTSSVPIFIQDNTRIHGDTWSLYLQDEWQPIKALTINYGVRYDQVRTVVNESQFSPRLGVVFDVNKDLRLHAGYASYFTPPPTETIDTTSVQKFVNTTNALPSSANTAVRSERSNYFDVGMAYQATPQLTVSIDGYYRRVKHLQDEGQFGNALIFSAFNFEQGRIYGLDFSATYKSDRLGGYVNLGVSQALGRGIETGQFNFPLDELETIQSHWVHLDHDQRLSGSAGLSYRLDDGLSASADMLFGSGLRKGFANTDHLPSYATVNASLAKTFEFGESFGKLDARVAVLNMFDRSYQLRDGSGIGVGAPQFGRRRSLFVSLSKPF